MHNKASSETSYETYQYPYVIRARKRQINSEHINFLKVSTTLGQPAG